MRSLMLLSFSCSFYTLLFVLLLFGSSTTTTTVTSNVSDHEALLQFKSRITHDPLGAMSSWNHTTHFCQWYGVNCSKRHRQRVTRLRLNFSQLSGSISPYIGNLTFLKSFRLQNNSFSKEIPPQIGHLRRLKLLDLSNNSITGKVPVNLSSCSNLLYMYLDKNQLAGEIHAEFGSLIKLKDFVMRDNQLTGSIPLSLGNLSSLLYLDVSDNNYLQGSIPHTLGQLRNLTYIVLGGNRLSGVVPPGILNLSSILIFDLGGNQLQGTLPVNLGTMLPNLQFFSVEENHFTGLFPVSLANVSSLDHIQLGQNNFSGSVPSLGNLRRLTFLDLPANSFGSGGEENDLSFVCTLANATLLEILSLNDNYFGGMLPDCIGNLSTKLSYFRLDTNLINGRFPAEIDSLTSLTRLHLWNNQFSGAIPTSIGRLQNLVSLDLGVNQFSDHIPSSLGNLTRLITLFLSVNNLEGNIPPSLGNCQNLLTLSLSDNSLSGAIPPEIFKLSSLSIGLDISMNRLTGPLPMEVQSLKNVELLDISQNMLSGGIPSTLGSCISLEILWLQGNQFHGSIPSVFSSLRALKDLDLSRNNLSGKIPEFFADFRVLVSLNLSYNKFEGALPTSGVFRNATATSVIGNSQLCGGVPEFHLPTCSLHNHQRRKILMISVICGVFGVISFLAFILVLLSKSKRRKDEDESPMSRVSYNDLLKATDGFSSANLIGKGSFGAVYKGFLHQYGNVVAIKVLKLSRKGADKSFMAECKALRNIRHRNLVKVLTACSGTDNHGNDFKALVYEFMVNGSLEEWLHAPAGNGMSAKNLSFVQRLDIAIDVSCALEYLHQHCETPIVHCDLKPSNVLLDNDMVGHVGDFGLAKFLAESDTNQSSSIGVRGTIGYAPPEYGLGSEVSMQGDVYSFGILLLEMFTAKRSTDSSFEGDGLSLRNYVMSALPNQVAEIIDPVILLLLQEERNIHQNRRRRFEIEQVLDHLIVILKIGISCSVEIPKERIPIGKAVAELHSIRKKFVQS